MLAVTAAFSRRCRAAVRVTNPPVTAPEIVRSAAAPTVLNVTVPVPASACVTVRAPACAKVRAALLTRASSVVMALPVVRLRLPARVVPPAKPRTVSVLATMPAVPEIAPPAFRFTALAPAVRILFWVMAPPALMVRAVALLMVPLFNTKPVVAVMVAPWMRPPA